MLTGKKHGKQRSGQRSVKLPKATVFRDVQSLSKGTARFLITVFKLSLVINYFLPNFLSTNCTYIYLFVQILNVPFIFPFLIMPEEDAAQIVILQSLEKLLNEKVEDHITFIDKNMTVLTAGIKLLNNEELWTELVEQGVISQNDADNMKVGRRMCYCIQLTYYFEEQIKTFVMISCWLCKNNFYTSLGYGPFW